MDNVGLMDQLMYLLAKETDETDNIYLYKGDDDVWYAYERSAYLVTYLFPYSKSYFVGMGDSFILACTEIKLRMPENIASGGQFMIRGRTHCNEREFLDFYRTLKQS